MEFIKITTEQSSSITNIVLGLFSLFFAISVYKKIDKSRAINWTVFFSLASFSALVGAIGHGFIMTDETKLMIYQPIFLTLGFTIAFFISCILFDLFGKNISKKLKPLFLGIAAVFYLVTLFIPGNFTVFIIYEIIAMSFGLFSYLYLFISKKLKGAWFIFLGILITILAAIIQASNTIHINAIWQFDNNGLFHIVQIVGISLMYLGVIQTKNKTV